MVAGDTVVIRVYVKDQNGATMRVWTQKTLTDAQTNEPVWFAPFLPTKQYKVTIQRTAGTDRAFTWQRVVQT